MINLELWRDRRNNPQAFYTKWDSFGKDFDSFFKLFDGPARPEQGAVLTACDIQENEKGFLLSLDMPGIRKEDIQIDIKGQTLLVSGQRQRKLDSEATRYRHSERYHGTFSRSFTLPDNIDDEKIEASFENGVLYLFLPKEVSVEAKKITISEGSLLKDKMQVQKEENDSRQISA